MEESGLLMSSLYVRSKPVVGVGGEGGEGGEGVRGVRETQGVQRQLTWSKGPEWMEIRHHGKRTAFPSKWVVSLSLINEQTCSRLKGQCHQIRLA